MHVAAAEGNAEMLRMMLMQGARADQETSRGRTAKEIARQRGHQKAGDDGYRNVHIYIHAVIYISYLSIITYNAYIYIYISYIYTLMKSSMLVV